MASLYIIGFCALLTRVLELGDADRFHDGKHGIGNEPRARGSQLHVRLPRRVRRCAGAELILVNSLFDIADEVERLAAEVIPGTV